MVEIRRIDVGSVALEVAEAGSGQRPLMLVHGFTGSKDDFGHFVAPLAELGWHVVAPDLRGHGSSDHPEGEHAYDFPLLAGDLLALAGRLGWDRFHLVAHSMGGMLAQMLALDHPHRLAGMVLMSTFHGPVKGIDPDLIGLGSMVVRNAGMEGLHQALAYRRSENPKATALFERMERERPGWGERSRERLLATSPDLWLSLAPKFIAPGDRLERLAGVDTPTHVIVGEHDSTMRDDCERIASTIPDAKLAVIPDAAHSPQFENEPACWEALVAFLDDLATRS